MKRSISDDVLRTALNEALSEALAVAPRSLTRRDVRLPKIAGKTIAVVGVRRGGKTSFLRHHMAEQLAAGRPRESLLFLSLEDERLAGITGADIGWMIDEHARQFPSLAQHGARTLYFDEVQLTDGWEKLVRRLTDNGTHEIFVSGSSAKLLSREVATSLRGRAMEVRISPFSFREALRHAGAEPTRPWAELAPDERSRLDAAFRDYLTVGGFPEAQATDSRDRLHLLKGYVDVMVLRDVIERHRVSSPHALRWLQRHLLATPGGGVSIRKLTDTLRSQGTPISKDTLTAYLDHLGDAFLVTVIELHTASERQRMLHPRKVYPIDTGLISLYETDARTHDGRALETAVLLELQRREYEVSYLKTDSDFEVDFHAHRHREQSLLVQVCLSVSDESTWNRELRALGEAARAHPKAKCLLITRDSVPPSRALPDGIEWRSASEWMLESS
jgi:predicted AAA+ superfamily ATPase